MGDGDYSAELALADKMVDWDAVREASIPTKRVAELASVTADISDSSRRRARRRTGTWSARWAGDGRIRDGEIGDERVGDG